MKKQTKYSKALEVFLCHVWDMKNQAIYASVCPIDVLMGARSLHNFTRGIDDDYWLLCDAVHQAMARVYHSDKSDPWSKWIRR